jgi:serine/threonine protein kinase
MPAFSLEGQTLGKYRILQPLGQGGMARVYRAYHPQLDRYVAVKVLRSDLAGQEEMLARFRREAQAVAALRHPHIIQVFDFDVQEDLYYMVMELVEGDTLKARGNDYRARGVRFPLGDGLRILLDVLDGLEYAHQAGVIHRDLKPANILLTRDGQAVLSDFGIAQILGGTQHTATGILMGTLHYMAPEQGMERGDRRSDIYSIGVMLYEMLIGRVPFDADTPLAILMKHMNDPLPLPRSFRPEIPESVERVIFRALAKAPDDRFQTAAEMAAALELAAAEAIVEIPERISPAFSFSTPDARGESVAVFSGTQREMVPDPESAKDCTDSTLGEKIRSHACRSLNTPNGTVPPKGIRIVWASLAAACLLFGFLALGINDAILTGHDTVLDKGWPLFILIPPILLCLLMEVLPIPALILPVPLLAWVAFLLEFYSLTGRWTFWSPWLLTPFFIFLGIAVLLWEKAPPAGKKPGISHKVGRSFLFAMLSAFVLCTVLLVVLSLFI